MHCFQHKSIKGCRIKGNIKKQYGKVTAVGTGGNISKIFELAQLKPHRLMSLKKIKETKAMIELHSMEDRIYKLQMNPDRADVIIPASDIYIRNGMGASKIYFSTRSWFKGWDASAPF